MAEKISFEKNLEKLEKIIEKMESADGGLDETVKLYEDGVKLAQSLNKMLDEAEQKVTVLAKKQNGIAEVDFEKVGE